MKETKKKTNKTKNQKTRNQKKTNKTTKATNQQTNKPAKARKARNGIMANGQMGKWVFVHPILQQILQGVFFNLDPPKSSKYFNLLTGWHF